MEKKLYAVIGGWGFRGGVRGLSTYVCDPQTSELTLVDSKFPNIAVGNQFYDKKNGILYFTDERKDKREQKGGGGYLCAASVREGIMDMISEKPSLLPNPSYVCLDRSGQYALVSHHVTDSYVTRLVRHEDGTYGSETIFDQAALVLFRVEPDGRLGEVCDDYTTEAPEGSLNRPVSHQHYVAADPTGEIYIVCDKGLDQLYSFRINRERGKLVCCDNLRVKQGSHPRYGVFHPQLPFFYGNHEEASYISQYQVDRETAKLTYISSCGLLEEGKMVESSAAPSDIAVSGDGKYLYVSIRGVNLISVLALSETGEMNLIQNISCGGENPRGLCMTPDGRYLYVCNVDTSRVVSFAVMDDGRLNPSGISLEVSRPGNMSMFIME